MDNEATYRYDVQYVFEANMPVSVPVDDFSCDTMEQVDACLQKRLKEDKDWGDLRNLSFKLVSSIKHDFSGARYRVNYSVSGVANRTIELDTPLDLTKDYQDQSVDDLPVDKGTRQLLCVAGDEIDIGYLDSGPHWVGYTIGNIAPVQQSYTYRMNIRLERPNFPVVFSQADVDVCGGDMEQAADRAVAEFLHQSHGELMQVTFERDGDGANFDLEPDKYHVLGFLGGSAECEVTLMEPLPGTFADCSDDYDEEASSKLPCDEDLARIESAVNSLDYGVLADSSDKAFGFLSESGPLTYLTVESYEQIYTPAETQEVSSVIEQSFQQNVEGFRRAMHGLGLTDEVINEKMVSIMRDTQAKANTFEK